MNQAQRKFLMDKIKERTKITIESFEKEEEPPSLNNYLLHEVLSGSFQIKSNEEIREMIRQKALTSKGDNNWMSGESNGWGSKWHLKFDAREFFILPDEYKKLWDDYRERQEERRRRIAEIQVQSDTLITRIQLASDKTLEKMISEVDDMGDISLMDTKLRLISGGTNEEKLLK